MGGEKQQQKVCGQYTVIDCFSKYAWLLPITQKKMEKVLEVLGPFLKEHTQGAAEQQWVQVDQCLHEGAT